MKTKLSKNSRGVIKTTIGEYHRAVENCNNIFYVNYEEGDENAQVMMFDRKHNLISNNYFAFEELTRVMKEEEHSWVSPKLKKIWEEVKKIW